MAEIRFEGVVKKFGPVTVLRSLDLVIRDGEFFTFVGPSGCGKSTVLNMIAGLEPVSAGNILFDGKVVNTLAPKERDVAMVFQSYALYPHMTVFDNIAFPLRMRKMPEKSVGREVEKTAAMLGIGDLLRRKPAELSGGQRQRVALGRALIRRPKVFLMDEPLSNLDARLRIEMRGELKKLHRDLGITAVYVTHDQAEAMSLSDRVAILHDGMVQGCGTPLQVYREPANLFVAGFIGNVPINLIPARFNRADAAEVDVNGMILRPALDPARASGMLTAGVRPEDTIISAAPGAGSVEVEVVLVEPAGPFNWVDVNWKGVAMKGISVTEEIFSAGDRAYMSFQADRVMYFDTASGKRI